MPREKIKFALRMSPETQQLVKEMCPRDNCQTQNEFIEKAIRFYAGYVSGQEATAYLPPALTRVMRGAVQDTENRTSYAMEMAEAMKIPWEQFRWYGSFHNEGTHPHVHMVCYSADGRSGFLDKNGIAKIKSGMAKKIFRQELAAIYQQQTQRRDELVQKSGEVMDELIQQMRSGTLENPRVEQLVEQLSQKLKHTSGKKQYGYLKAPLKVMVDEIVDELAKDSRIAATYNLWYRLREEVLRTYKDDLPQRLPLSRQKEFKRIKNLVIEEAVRLGGYMEVFLPEDTPKPVERDTLRTVIRLAQRSEQGDENAMYALGQLHLEIENFSAALRWLQRSAELGNQFAQYRLGKLLLNGDGIQKDTASAVRWLTESAEQGNQYAQYALGKLFLLGKDVPQDRDAAVRWFTLAAKQGNEYAQYFLDHMNDSPSLFTCAIWEISFENRLRPLREESVLWTANCGERSERRKSLWVIKRMIMNQSWEHNSQP